MRELIWTKLAGGYMKNVRKTTGGRLAPAAGSRILSHEINHFRAGQAPIEVPVVVVDVWTPSVLEFD
ncbi:MAG: hypothetical protein EPO23_05945 [Xanthobacteraceae bacterium]|nr:MAG: hypothetical protein EPO23_05945 [Xanthobacteraceae bacterium]